MPRFLILRDFFGSTLFDDLNRGKECLRDLSDDRRVVNGADETDSNSHQHAMKTNSRFTRSFVAVHVATALVLAAPPVFGQAATRNKDAEQAAKQKLETSAASHSLFEIEIADGEFTLKGRKVDATLPNVIELLRERHAGANIVLSPGLPRIKIANLKLRATSIEQELEALRVASGNKFMWGNGNNPAPMIDPVTGLPGSSAWAASAAPATAINPTTGLPVGPKDNQAPLYILSEVPGGMTGPGRRVEVFNLTGYFNSFGDADEESSNKRVDESLEQIKKIVTTTLQTVDEDRNSVIGFQFHAGANLLVVSGTPDALEVARKVVSALVPQGRSFGNTGGGGGGMAGGGSANPFGSGIPGNTISAASNKSRRAIASKLEGIRLETVGPWDLPLSEIVRLLNDEAKKRDPDKRGINFLINPNPPEAAPVGSAPGMPAAIDPTTGLPIAAALPTEMIDINSVTIRITLPLTNVRLVDVLDAMVKCADHPIRYSITDYAVVISLRGPESSMSETPFPGATPGFAPALP